MTEDLLADARRLSDQGFAARHDHLFLVKRPRAKMPSDKPAPSVEFRTTVVSTRKGSNQLDSDEFALSWVVAPIKKRAGNPFPLQISVGRALNCDIVLRVSYISKLHAMFAVGPEQTLSLVDNGSANGTSVNHKRLAARTTATVRSGDWISFGAAEFQLLESSEVYALLRSPGGPPELAR